MSRVNIHFDGVSRGAVAAAAQTRAAIRGVGQEATSTDRRVSLLGGTLSRTLVTSAKAGAVGLTGLAGSVAFVGIRFDDLKQRAQIAFTTMLGDGVKARRFLGELQAFAARTPFEFPDLIRASQRLLGMGVNARQVLPTLTAVGNAVAGIGGGAAEIDVAVRAIGQIQAKGRLMAEEMMQLNEAGVFSWRDLAREIGTSVPKAMSLVQRGAVTSDAFLAAFQQNSEHRFRGMMERQSHTFSGLLSTIKDNFSQLAGTAMQPLFNLMTGWMDRMVNDNGRLNASGQRVAHTIGVTVANAAQKAARFFETHWGGIKRNVRDVAGAVRDTAATITGGFRLANRVTGNFKETLKLIVALRVGAWAFRATAGIKAMGIAAETSGKQARLAAARTGIGVLVVVATEVILHWKQVKKFFGDLWVYLKLGAITAAKGVVEPFSHLPGIFGGWARKAKDALNLQFDQAIIDAATRGKLTGDAYGKAMYTGIVGWVKTTAGLRIPILQPAGPTGVTVAEAAAGAGGLMATQAAIVGTAVRAARSPGAHAKSFHLPGERTPYDCSAFTQAVFLQSGIHIGSTTYTQFAGGRKVAKNDLKPGDLVFFNYPGERSPGHVGIYVGRGMMVHDHGATRGVSYQAVDWGHYVGARCYLAAHPHTRTAPSDPGGPTTTPGPSAADLVDTTATATTRPKGTTTATVIGVRASIDRYLREFRKLTPAVRAHLSPLGVEAEKHLEELRKKLRTGMKPADLAKLRAGIQRWGKVLRDEIRKATDAAADEAAEKQRLLERRVDKAIQARFRAFEKQTEAHNKAFEKQTSEHIAAMRKAFELQMREFDRQTELGLRALAAPAVTPEEQALAQFRAQRDAEARAKELADALASGDQERIRQLQLDEQERFLEAQAEASRKAADESAEAAQDAYRQQREDQKNALSEQEQLLEDSYSEQRQIELDAWNERRAEQLQAMQDDLDDWMAWIDAKRKTWQEFLRWLKEHGFAVPDEWLTDNAGRNLDAAFRARVRDLMITLPQGTPMQAGGTVRAPWAINRDRVPLLAQHGETVIDHALTEKLEALVDGRLAGVGYSGPPVVIKNVQVLGTSERQVARAMVRLVEPQLSRRVGFERN